jgi:hypothetical protein
VSESNLHDVLPYDRRERENLHEYINRKDNLRAAREVTIELREDA